MAVRGRSNILAFSTVFLLLVLLISGSVIKEAYAKIATTPLTTNTQISNSDLETPSSITTTTNTSSTSPEVQNQNTSAITITTTTVTMTSILIHTTTLTFMITVSRGVAESHVVIFIIAIGSIAITIGYLTGYRNALNKQREVQGVQKRSKM